MLQLDHTQPIAQPALLEHTHARTHNASRIPICRLAQHNPTRAAHLHSGHALVLVPPYHQVQKVRQVPLLQAVLGVGPVLHPVLVQHKHVEPVLLVDLRGVGRAKPGSAEWRQRGVFGVGGGGGGKSMGWVSEEKRRGCEGRSLTDRLVKQSTACVPCSLCLSSSLPSRCTNTSTHAYTHNKATHPLRPHMPKLTTALRQVFETGAPAAHPSHCPAHIWPTWCHPVGEVVEVEVGHVIHVCKDMTS